MRSVLLIVCAVLALTPRGAAAQDDQAAAKQPGPATTPKVSEPPPPRTGTLLRTRANIKVDVTISDQTGNGPVEKKVVSVIAVEESLAKIRTHTDTRTPDGMPTAMRVALNVDARPFLTTSGAIQLELTVAYNPLGSVGKDVQVVRPTELNQSMTVVLQSGKPMVISQAADPIADRKMIVEVVATILK